MIIACNITEFFERGVHMIKSALTVRMLTGGYGCRATVETSKMSEKDLKKILMENGGKDKGEYCWFEAKSNYEKTQRILIEAGVHVT